MMENGKTAVVVPCYNEGSRLDPGAFSDFLGLFPGIDFWFVDDGSRDNTYEVISDLALRLPDRVFPVRLHANVGKAGAVRAGIQAAAGQEVYQYLGFLDADLATPPGEIPYMLDYARFRGWPGGMLFGSRVKILGSRIERNALRHYFGRVSATGASVCLGLPVYDTQCGIKLFCRETAGIAFRDPFLSRWLFDVEIFFRLKAAWDSAAFAGRVLEVPVRNWTEIPGTKIRFSDIVKVPMELYRIYRHYKPLTGW